MPTEGQINYFDFTISAANFSSHEALCLMFHNFCKKWVFQLEQGAESGNLHYQCRVSLIKKLRLSKCIETMRPILMNNHEPAPGHWVKIQPTSKTVAKQIQTSEDGGHSNQTNTGFQYVMKSETKVEGPWPDESFDVPKVMTRQLRAFVGGDDTMWPFQRDVLDLAKATEDRYITFIIETLGNTGKSILTEYMDYMGVACSIPCLKSCEDLMQMAMCMKPSPCYIIDMPRAIKKDNLWELYAGIELIKNGYAYDKRYEWRHRYSDRPQVCVFSNTFPEVSAMSADRWRVYRIDVPDNDVSLTRLEMIDNDNLELEHAINQTVVARELQQKKIRIGLGEEITNDLINEDDTWLKRPRSEMVAEVDRRVRFRTENNL